MKNSFNYIEISGKITDEPKIKETGTGKEIQFHVSSRRKSGTCDILRVHARTKDVSFKLHKDSCVFITGKLCGKMGNNFYINIAAEHLEKCPSSAFDVNKVTIAGFLTEDVQNRHTFISRNDIADLQLKCASLNGDSDHFHCVVFDDNATLLKGQKSGACVKLTGRLQSRIIDIGPGYEIVANAAYLVDKGSYSEKFEEEKLQLDKEEKVAQFFAGAFDNKEF